MLAGCFPSLLLALTTVFAPYPTLGVLGMGAHSTAILIGTLAIAPLLFIPSFKKLSWLSMAGCISTVLVTATVVTAVAIDPTREQMPIQARASPVWLTSSFKAMSAYFV